MKIKKTSLCILALLAAVVFLARFSAPVQAAKSYSNKKTTKSNPVVVLYIQYSSGAYSDAYGASRDISICPVKEKPGYRLYDIIIYPDRINLYCFPNMTNWDSFAAFYTQKYGAYDTRTAETEQAAWKAFRDKYLMKSTKVKSGTYESPDPDKNSSKRLKAYKNFFKAIRKKTPSKHIVVKYQGHGNMLPVFCQSLSLSHTKKVLEEAVKTFGCKLALVDYGTNCYTLTPDLCEMYAPYVDYILGCAGEWTYSGGDGAIPAEAQHYEDINAIYAECFPLGTTMKKAAIRSWTNNTKSVKLTASKALKRDKVLLSQTLVDPVQYNKLIKSLKNRNTANLEAACKTKKLKKLYKKTFLKHFSTQELGVSWPAWSAFPFL